jgi:hypothetical protein
MAFAITNIFKNFNRQVKPSSEVERQFVNDMHRIHVKQDKETALEQQVRKISLIRN